MLLFQQSLTGGTDMQISKKKKLRAESEKSRIEKLEARIAQLEKQLKKA